MSLKRPVSNTSEICKEKHHPGKHSSKAMGKKKKGQQMSVDAIDKYLAELQLARKPVAKDGSCLFRAVADQAWLTQANYTKLRWLCGDYIQQHRKDFKEFLVVPVTEYCWKLKHTQMWGGEMELVALSKLLKRKIVLYQEKAVEKDRHQHQSHQHPLQPQVTIREFGEEFGDKEEPIMLAFTGNNHYDMVWSTKSRDNHALSQSIVYGLLLEKVFQEPVGKPLRDQLLKLKETDSPTARSLDRQSTTKHSEQLLRALDPQLYSNVALEMEKREREVRELKDRHVAASMQFQHGDRCHVTLDNGKRVRGEIVAVNVAPPADHNEHPTTKWAQVTIYEEGGESRRVPYRSITLTGNSSRNSSSNRGQGRTSNQGATADHSHGGSHQHTRPQQPLPLPAPQQQSHSTHAGGQNRTNHQPGRSHNNHQQQPPQVQSLRGKPHQQKGGSVASTSASIASKGTLYSHAMSAAAASSSVAEHKRRDQQSSKSRQTANPPQPPPAESILPLPTPPIATRNLQLVLDNQSHSNVPAVLDGQFRKTKKTTGYKRTTAPATVGPKSLPQNALSETSESPHYYKSDGVSAHYPPSVPTSGTGMQKSGLDHTRAHPAVDPHQRPPLHQQLVNTNGLRSDGSTSTSGSSDPESPPAHQNKHLVPPRGSSVFFTNSYSTHPHKQDGSGSSSSAFASHPPTVTATSSSSHTHHTSSNAGGGRSSYSHNPLPHHPPVGSAQPSSEPSTRQKPKNQSGSRVSRAQPYHYLPLPTSGGGSQQQRQPTSEAAMFSESTMYMTSLMGRSFPQEVLTQSQLSAITDAPECEWPILNPVGNKNPLQPSLPSSLHIDGPPVNPSGCGLPVSMDNVNSQTVQMMPFLYSTDHLQILMHELNPPVHLLHNGGTLESRRQFMFDYAQRCLQVYSKYINDPDLEDVLGELMCMRLEDFSSSIADGQLSVCTSYTSRADSETTELTPMFEPHPSYANYTESAFFQQDALQGEGEGADEEEEYEEEDRSREAEQSCRLNAEEKQFLPGSQQQRRQKAITPPSISDTTSSQSPVVVSPNPVDQEEGHSMPPTVPPSSSQEQEPTEPSTSTSLPAPEGNRSNELSGSKPSLEEGLVSSGEGLAEQSGSFPPPSLYHPAMMHPPPFMYARPGLPYYPAPYPMYYPMAGMPYPWMFHPAMIPQMQMMMMPGPFQQPIPLQLPMEDPTAGDKEVQGSLAEESEKASDGPTRTAAQDSNPQPLVEEQPNKVMLSSQDSQSSSQQSSESSGTAVSQPVADHLPPSSLNASSQDTLKEGIEQVSEALPASHLAMLGSTSNLPLPSLPCRNTQMDKQKGTSKPNLSPSATDYEPTPPTTVPPTDSKRLVESSEHSQQEKTAETSPLSTRIESTTPTEPAAAIEHPPTHGAGSRDMQKGGGKSHNGQFDGSQQQQRLKSNNHRSYYHNGPYHYNRQQQYHQHDEGGEAVEPRESSPSHYHHYPSYHNGGQYSRNYYANNRPGRQYNNSGERRTVRRNYPSYHYQQDQRSRQPMLRQPYYSNQSNQYSQYGHAQNKHYPYHKSDQYYSQRGYQHHSRREYQSSDDRTHHSKGGGDRNVIASAGTGDAGSRAPPSGNRSAVVDSNTVL